MELLKDENENLKNNQSSQNKFETVNQTFLHSNDLQLFSMHIQFFVKP